MKILVLAVLSFATLLSACSQMSASPYDGQKRGVVGEFCPAKEAIKGNC
ncbi:MAG: hypothetical protein JSS58_08435 [Proteobacteria bacterium]|nr:hypothetical protein [Pseudomonadota bacterium]